jgi:predicted molibdopterin-dependent oxidoreductase YjgC
VFEAWKKASAGRPCDYTGLTYDPLTGGSGIQWPYNAKSPQGTERLYSDGKFPTDLENCESFGHNPETGAPYTKAEYESLNPAGRAILKTCPTPPPIEVPDEKYLLRLSTGRKVYHFHTRTKTGRTALQQACPEPEVRVSEKDAANLNVCEGEMVVVRSRNGAVELRCAEGHIFIPFHFGYWDSEDGGARAANELTSGSPIPVQRVTISANPRQTAGMPFRNSPYSNPARFALKSSPHLPPAPTSANSTQQPSTKLKPNPPPIPP